MRSYDFVVIGAGIVGLTVARALAVKRLGSVCVLEKEASLGRHSSGRNSGVVHAGIYYEPGSLKARVCVEGARRLTAYAEERSIPFKKIGKFIVAPAPGKTAVLDALYERANANGVRIEKISETELLKEEPETRTYGFALYSPDTAIIDSKKVLEVLEKEISGLGVEVRKGTKVLRAASKYRRVETPKERFLYGHLVNCAGLQADRIAHEMQVGRQYRVVPFKGTYRRLTDETGRRFHRLVYSAPDPVMPFLGVHIAKTLTGETMIGPTAIPVFGRENYKGMESIRPAEFPRILADLAGMVFGNKEFRKAAKEAFEKHTLDGFLRAARAVAPYLEKHDLLPSDKAGIRPQLVETRTKRLVMDFVVESGPSSTHVLNAVSPAFTSSFAFADVVVEKIKEG